MSCGHKPENGASIWKALLAQGATPVQAVGIMANMWFESNWDPQCYAIDSNGLPSVGLVNWNNNPTAAGLRTGNDANDILSQVAYLVQSGGLQAAGVSNDPGQAASSFAHNYEKCAACGYQGGSSQLTARAAYAQGLYPLALAGKWGSKVPSGSGTTGALDSSTSGGSSDCAFNLKFKLPIVGGPDFCIWHAGWSRAILGSLLIGAGGIVALAGIGLLVGSEAIASINKVPGGAGAVGKATAAMRVIGK